MQNKTTRRGHTKKIIKNKVILNLIQDLQRLPLSLINNVRGRCQIKFGMTTLLNNGGFTLIELLVVVLIISILAAVALPQYQFAVEKSRLAEPLSILPTIQTSIEEYVLSNGYPSSMPAGKTSIQIEDDLIIQFGSSKNFTYDIYCGTNYCKAKITRRTNGIESNPLQYQLDATYEDGVWTKTCEQQEDLFPIAEKICNILHEQGWE